MMDFSKLTLEQAKKVREIAQQLNKELQAAFESGSFIATISHKVGDEPDGGSRYNHFCCYTNMKAEDFEYQLPYITSLYREVIDAEKEKLEKEEAKYTKEETESGCKILRINDFKKE